MLTPTKSNKLLQSLKNYQKQYLTGKHDDLDESGTRLMINYFLAEVLGYIPLEEIKTEYMIKGTYADYMVQTGGVRHFLVEVKALSIGLSEKHLRQTINYGANEGVEWALLTNGRSFDLYKILFNKPIEAVKVFTIDLTDNSKNKEFASWLCYLHKDATSKKSLHHLWNKSCALDPVNIAGLLYSPGVTGLIRRELKSKHNASFSIEDIEAAITILLCKPVDLTKVKRVKVEKKKKAIIPINVSVENNLVSQQ